MNVSLTVNVQYLDQYDHSEYKTNCFIHRKTQSACMAFEIRKIVPLIHKHWGLYAYIGLTIKSITFIVSCGRDLKSG